MVGGAAGKSVSIVLLTVVLGFAAASDLSWGQERRRERLYLLVDCSGSMSNPDPASRRGTGGVLLYDSAVEKAMTIARGRLHAGWEIYLVPFDLEARGEPRDYSVLNETQIPAVLDRMRAQLRPFRPTSMARGTALWDTLYSFLSEFKQDARYWNVLVITDKIDTASQRKEEDLKKLLSEKWGYEARGRGIWLLDITAKATAVFSPVSVQLLDWSAEHPLSYIRNSPDPLLCVRVRLVTPEAGHRVSHFTASVQRRLPGGGIAPDPVLRVERIELKSPLSAEHPEGVLDLHLDGSGIAPGIHNFEISLRFFATEPTPDGGQVEVERVAAEIFQYRVSSHPSVSVGVRDHQTLEMLPGERQNITVLVRGNEDAAGMECSVRCVSRAGVLVSLSDRTADDMGGGTADEIRFRLPASSEAKELICSILATAPTEQSIGFGAVIPGVQGASSQASLPVRVLRPSVRSSLANSGMRAELSEDAAERPYEPLACGPIVIDGQRLPKGSAIRLAVEKGEFDLDVSLGEERLDVLTIPMDGSSVVSVPLFGRWRVLPPSESLSAPQIRITVVSGGAGGYEILAEPPQLSLAGAAVPSAPAFWLEPIDPGPRKAVPGDEIQVSFLFGWNVAAMGGRFTAHGDSEDGAAVLKFLSADPSLFVSDGTLELPREAGTSRAVPRSMRLSAVLRLPAVPPAGGKVRLAFDFDVALRSGAVLRAQTTVTYDVRPPRVYVDVGPMDEQVVDILPGFRIPLRECRIQGETADAHLRFRFVDPETGEDSPVQCFVGDGGASEASVPAGGDRTLLIWAEWPSAQSPGDGEMTAELAVDADAAQVEVWHWDGEDRDRRLDGRLAVRFRPGEWSIECFSGGSRCRRFPPRGWFEVSGSGDFMSSADMRPAFELCTSPRTDVTDGMAAKEVHATLVGGGEVLGTVGFLLDPAASPIERVTVGQLNQGAVGLVVFPAENLSRSMFVSRFVEATVVVSSLDDSVPISSLRLLVRVKVLPILPVGWLLGLALFLCGAAVWGWFEVSQALRRRRQSEQDGIGEMHQSEDREGDDDGFRLGGVVEPDDDRSAESRPPGDAEGSGEGGEAFDLDKTT